MARVSKSFGAVDVLKDVTFQIDYGQKVGVVGENGAGKSTLLRLITGDLHQDDGEVEVHGGARIECLDQMPHFDVQTGARAEVMACRPDLADLEARIERLAQCISHPDLDERGRSVDRLMTLHAEALEQFGRLGGHEFEATVARVLAGLGLDEQEQNLPMGRLSGGQRSRVALAKVLLGSPDLLMLDEPTNHLDIQATEWLQDHLTSFAGAVLVISHDRAFLDAVCRRVLEVEDCRVSAYSGGFTAYNETKERELAAQAKAYELQQRELRRQEEYIRWRLQQGRDKSVRAAKSRAKLIARIERIERPTLNRRRPVLRFAEPRSGSNDIVELTDLSKAYGDRELFSHINLLVRRGNRIGLVGPNGSGKTTLIRIILGDEPPTSGRARLGPNVRVGYYCQEREDLDRDRTVMDHVRQVRPDLDLPSLRSFLARFLFFGDSVFLPIASLSGGECSRVALAQVIVQRPDFLILDEPTNHLDIASQEVFEDALIDYTGTILLASHDRYFLDRTVEQLLVFGEGRAELFHGAYSAFSAHQAAERARQAEELGEQRAAERRARLADQRRRAAEQRPRARRDDAEAIARPEEVEGRILVAEARLQAVAAELAKPDLYNDGEAVRACRVEYGRLTDELEELYDLYARTSEL